MTVMDHYCIQPHCDQKKLACPAVMDPVLLSRSLVETDSPPTCHLFPLQLSPGSEEDEAHEGCSRENLGRIQFSVGYNFQESTLTVKVMKAQELPAKDFSGTSDPFVKIYLLPDKKHKLETKVKRKNLNPHWNETFLFEGEAGATPSMPLAPPPTNPIPHMRLQARNMNQPMPGTRVQAHTDRCTHMHIRCMHTLIPCTHTRLTQCILLLAEIGPRR